MKITRPVTRLDGEWSAPDPVEGRQAAGRTAATGDQTDVKAGTERIAREGDQVERIPRRDEAVDHGDVEGSAQGYTERIRDRHLVVLGSCRCPAQLHVDHAA